jgi:hypothetical protein
MRRVVILAELPDRAFLRGALGDSDGCVISLTPWLSEQLDEADISSRLVSDYADTEGWEDIHAELWRALAGQAGGVAPSLPPWLHDWSHFLIDELRTDLYWARVAKRIVDLDSPTELMIQRVSPQNGPAEGLSALAGAFDLLGQRWSYWEPQRQA